MSTVRPIDPRELLDLADHLLAQGASRGGPRPIWLRRSISTSDDAVFHELSYRAVSRPTGSPTWGATEAAVSRWIAHTDLADLARAATGSGGSPLRVGLGALDARVVLIAEDFLALQVARHSADYDDELEVSQDDAAALAATARSIVALSRELTEEGESSYARFLGLALGAVKVAKERRPVTR